MKVIARGRATGRTTELIKLAAEGFLYVVCPDRKRCEQIAEMARQARLDIPFPLSWREFTDGHVYAPGVRGFVVDDLDRCVQSMTGAPVVAVSLETGE